MKLNGRRIAIGAASGALASIVAWRAIVKARGSKSAAGDAANESFHRAYDEARAREAVDLVRLDGLGRLEGAGGGGRPVRAHRVRAEAAESRRAKT